MSSSLFGNLGNQTSQPTSSLFGNLNTPKTTASTGGLFGSTLGGTSQPQSSSLFGSSPATSTAQPSSGLFGATTASAAQPSGGLFGATSTAQPSGGLFGAAASQPQQGGSLFPAATSAPQTSSLFGNNQQAQGGSTPSGSTLFGSTQQPQSDGTSGNSLFGSAQPAQTSSLFGNTQPAQTISLFGAQPPSQGSTFNSMQQSQNGQNGQNPQNSQKEDGKKEEPKPAFFDSLLEKGRKRKVGESSLDGLPSLELGLGDIRQRIKALHSGGHGASVGTAHYLLRGSGVDPSTADLSFFESQAASKPRAEARTEARAETPPTTDTDVDSYLANIQSQTTLSMIAEGLARSVQDFDTFLEDNVTMEWDAQRKRIYDHFGIKPKDESNGMNSSFSGSSFGRSAFGRSSRQTKGPSNRASQAPGASALGRQSMQRSVIGTPGPVGLGRSTNVFPDIEKQKESSGSSTWTAPDNLFLQRRQKQFIEVVNKFNEERKKKKRPYAVLSEFSKITSDTGDQQSQSVAHAYEAVSMMVDESSDPQSLPRATSKERAFSDAYLNEAPATARTVSIKKTILTGANKYLERKFYQHLEAEIDSKPREARLGGVPSVINKVKGYIRVLGAVKNLHSENEFMQRTQDDYPWAIVFYLIRSGHIQEAANYVEEEIVAFRSIDRYFPQYIQEYARSEDRRLSRTLQERIHHSYQQIHHVAPAQTIDPFRVACYKIIGRCDLENRKFDGLPPNLDHFIWLQFNLAREVSRANEFATEVYGLDEVRTAISEIGARHFTAKTIADKNSVYGMYFYLQVLCGLFEQAVAYLYPFNHVDAIHFAIALSYYGLLRVSAPGTTTDLLSYSTRQEAQLNFGPMVAYYTRDFRAADVVAAVDYITLICLNADLPGEIGRQQAHLCYEALRELVLESREFAELLGDIRYDGQRIRGAIENYVTLIGLDDGDDFLRNVTISAASMADDSGRVIDAVLLYHLAREFDLVLAIINRALSEAINIDIDQDPLRLQPLKPRDEKKLREQEGSSLSLTSVDDPAELARTILHLYMNNQGSFRLNEETNRNTCQVLLRMNDAKKQVQEGKWAMALDTMANLEIIPLNGSVREAAAKFGALPQTVARNVPCLILWSLGCINQERERLASAAFGQNAQSARERLYEKSKDLMVFAGAIKYHMPQHVYDTMSRLSTWRD